jgi:hypothetical protein
VLTIILLLVPLQKLNLAVAVSARVAVIMGLTVLGYVVAVYLIFFLTYTPLNIDHVRGVQGRYFVIALPMAAIFLASMADVDLPRGVLATTAIVDHCFRELRVSRHCWGHIGQRRKLQCPCGEPKVVTLSARAAS